MKYLLSLDIGSGFVDYDCIMREGFSLKECVGAKGQHESQTCQLKIRSATVRSLLLTQQKSVKAQLKRDGVVIFSGVIRPSLSVSTKGNFTDSMSIQIIDNTEILHQYVYDSATNEAVTADLIAEKTFYNYYVCNPNSESNSLVHVLFGLCNIPVVKAPTLTAQVSRFDLNAGDYIDNVISTLLYEYLCTYRMTPSGAEISEVFAESSGTVEDLTNTLTVKKSDSTSDGVSVTFPKYVTYENFEVYSESIYNVEESAAGHLGEHLYWPVDSHDKTEARWWDFSGFTAGTKVAARNFKVMSYNSGGSYFYRTNHIDDADQEKGYPYVEYWGWFGIGHKGMSLEVYCDIDYTKDDAATAGVVGLSPTKYSAKYIHTLDAAQPLADMIQKLQQGAIYSYTFQSPNIYAPGTIVTLNEGSNLHVATSVRILSRTTTELGTALYTYSAEGADEVAITASEFELEREDKAPVTDVSFLTIRADKNIFNASTAEDIYVLAEGTAFDWYNCVPTWTFNNVTQDNTTTTLKLSSTSLNPGQNIVSVSATANGTTVTRSLALQYIVPAVGISSVYSEYAVSTSATTAPTTGWSTDLPDRTSDEYLWIRDVYTYSDGTSATIGTRPVTGDDGVGIQSINQFWAKSNSNTVAPTDGWSTTKPTTEDGEYLWTKIQYILTDFDSYTSDPYVVTGEQGPQGEQGEKGDTGKTGQYTAYQYYASTSDQEPEGGSWSDAPVSIEGGKFLFIRQQIVPAGGAISDTAWSTPALSGTDISNVNAQITEANNQITLTQTKVQQNAEDISLGAFKVDSDGKVVSYGGVEVGAWGNDSNGSFIRLIADAIFAKGTLNADLIDVADLMAQELTIRENGCIHSANYEPSVAGWYIGNGRVEFNSITARGNIEAASISHDTLRTVPGSDPVVLDKTFAPTLWKRTTGVSKMGTSLKSYMETLSGATFGSKTILRMGLAHNQTSTSNELTAPAKISSLDTIAGDLEYGRYSYNTSIQSQTGRKTIIPRLRNAKSVPVYVHVKAWVGGTWAYTHVNVYDAGGSKIIDNKRFINGSTMGFWLEPGYSVAVQGINTSWGWGWNSADGNVQTFDQNQTAHLLDNRLTTRTISASSTATAGNVKRNSQKLTVPAGAKYINVAWAVLDASNDAGIEVQNATAVSGKSGWYAINTGATTVTVSAIARTTTGTDDEGSTVYTASSVTIYGLSVYFYSCLPSSGERLQIAYTDGSIEDIALSTDEVVTSYESRRLQAYGYDSNSWLTKIEGSQIYAHLMEKIGSFGEYSLNSESTQFITVNGTKTQKTFTFIDFTNSEGFDLIDSSDTRYHYSTAAGVLFDSYQIQAALISQLPMIEVKNIIPKEQNRYSCGSDERRWAAGYFQHLFLGGKTAGVGDPVLLRADTNWSTGEKSLDYEWQRFNYIIIKASQSKDSSDNDGVYVIPTCSIVANDSTATGYANAFIIYCGTYWTRFRFKNNGNMYCNAVTNLYVQYIWGIN